MKSQVIDKNGFPKLFGLLLIFMLISLLCLVQCMFNKTVSTKTTYDNNNLPSIELETKIQAKTWMVDENCRNEENKSGLFAEKNEPEIIAEPWIVNL